MKKINYSSLLLRHLFSGAIVIVICSFIAACFLIPVAVSQTTLFVLLILLVIALFYLGAYAVIDSIFSELEHEKTKNKHKENEDNRPIHS